MLKNTLMLCLMALLAACAMRRADAPPDQGPPPVEISEVAPAPATEAPSPDAPPPDAPPAPAGKPAQTDSGRFRISVASLDTLEATKPWVQKAEAAGYRTELWEVVIDGKTWQRVLLPGYVSLADAQAALPYVQQDLGAPGAWVTSRRRAPGPADAPADAPPPPAPPGDMPAPPPPAPEAPAN